MRHQLGCNYLICGSAKQLSVAVAFIVLVVAGVCFAWFRFQTNNDSSYSFLSGSKKVGRETSGLVLSGLDGCPSVDVYTCDRPSEDVIREVERELGPSWNRAKSIIASDIGVPRLPRSIAIFTSPTTRTNSRTMIAIIPDMSMHRAIVNGAPRMVPFEEKQSTVIEICHS